MALASGDNRIPARLGGIGGAGRPSGEMAFNPASVWSELTETEI